MKTLLGTCAQYRQYRRLPSLLQAVQAVQAFTILVRDDC
jgi:hypothetical protein